MTTETLFSSVQSEFDAILQKLEGLLSMVALATTDAKALHVGLTVDVDVADAAAFKAERSAELEVWKLQTMNESIRSAASGIAASKRLISRP